MATGLHNNLERVPENLKEQLAIAVRSIQWSYAIFWSISARQPGYIQSFHYAAKDAYSSDISHVLDGGKCGFCRVLEWGDGYYNGEIKTRKTVQSIELNADELGLQRSEQLRELYESLSAGEASPQARRPSAALSPEDLTDTEWYYLVCMSFVFDIGQGLPGRTLANGHPTWLCNAHSADSKVFSRSLLAKSASIQTVVCFPFLRGVVELGVTEQVLEDPSVIQHVKTSFLEIPYPVVAKNSCARSDKEFVCATFNEIVDNESVPVIGCEKLDIASPNNSSNIQPAEGSVMVEGLNGGASQVQSWQFIDDDFSNCAHHSMNSSDCISQTIVDPVKVVPVLKNENVNALFLQDVQDCNRSKLTALNLRSDDLHYQSVLTCLLKTSHPLILGPNFQNSHQESSFVSWRKVGLESAQKFKSGTSQNLLKKILLEIRRTHADGFLESPESNNNKIVAEKLEVDEMGANHVLAERKRREELKKRFMILKSVVPSTSKVDKVSILDDTIEYLQELERKVEELESCRELIEARTNRRPQDTVERTSDNYGSNKSINCKKSLTTNKRKAPDIDEIEPDIDYNVSKDGSSDNITVSMNNEDVLVEIKCLWREGILLEIMDAASHLHLDSHSVQSSIIDGILSLTIKFKHKGLTTASVATIKQALQRVAGNC